MARDYRVDSTERPPRRLGTLPGGSDRRAAGTDRPTGRLPPCPTGQQRVAGCRIGPPCRRGHARSTGRPVWLRLSRKFSGDRAAGGQTRPRRRGSDQPFDRSAGPATPLARCRHETRRESRRGVASLRCSRPNPSPPRTLRPSGLGADRRRLPDARHANRWPRRRGLGRRRCAQLRGSKPLTAGNGGAVLTDRDPIASRLNAWLDRPSDSAPMSELQAAALLPQLDRLGECNQIRSETVSAITAGVDWIRQATADGQLTPPATFYKFAFLCERRDAMLETLRRAGLPVGPGYRSMHRSSDRRCDKVGPLDRCRLLGEQLCLLDHSALLATGPLRTQLVERLSEAAPCE
ncbi:MAG: hypothetical protein F9B45_30090 [Phycisphaera sp. RhM]|nr:hypothetical protein [Phycisphaera sp. RhM]